MKNIMSVLSTLSAVHTAVAVQNEMGITCPGPDAINAHLVKDPLFGPSEKR